MIKIPLLEDLEPDFIAEENGMPLIKYHYLKRYTQAGNRFYYDIKDDKLIPYMSYSTFSNMVLPKGAAYYSWLANKGTLAELEREEKKIFGGLFHRVCVQIVKGGDPVHGNGYDFDWLTEYWERDGVRKRILDETGERWATNFDMMVPQDWRHKSYSWLKPFKKGLMSWIAFLQDRVVRVVAMELPLKSDELQIALTMDFVAEIKFGSKTVLGYVDIKSNLDEKKKNYYDSHALQMELGRYVWNENYDWKITHMFNWSPVDFKKDKPTYQFENQTNNEFGVPVKVGKTRMHQLEWMSAWLKARGKITPPSATLDIVGKFDDWREMDYSKHLVNYSLIKD